MSERLDDAVRRLIASSGMNDTELGALCGRTSSWVYSVKLKKIKDPSFEPLQKIYEHLTGKPLVNDA